jgi:hypothetical protein
LNLPVLKSGKEEIFRCRWGNVYLYVSGTKNRNPKLDGLENYKEYLKVDHEIVLNPGEQYTLMPDTWHWFRARDKGAVVSAGLYKRWPVHKCAKFANAVGAHCIMKIGTTAGIKSLKETLEFIRDYE